MIHFIRCFAILIIVTFQFCIRLLQMAPSFYKSKNIALAVAKINNNYYLDRKKQLSFFNGHNHYLLILLQFSSNIRRYL